MPFQQTFATELFREGDFTVTYFEGCCILPVRLLLVWQRCRSNPLDKTQSALSPLTTAFHNLYYE